MEHNFSVLREYLRIFHILDSIGEEEARVSFHSLKKKEKRKRKEKKQQWAFPSAHNKNLLIASIWAF